MKPSSEKIVLWMNANLATMNAGQPYGRIHKGGLAIEGGKIVWVGKADLLPAAFKEKAIQINDVKGRWITPGFIDCHTHLVYGGNRAGEFEKRLQGISYEEIARAGGGIQATVAATRQSDEAALIRQSLPRLKSLIQTGATTVEIKSGYGLDLATELRMLRVAKKLGEMLPVTVIPTYLGAHALPVEFHNRPNDYIDYVCGEVLPQVVAEGLALAADAFCETIGFTRNQTEKVFQSARQHGLPVKIHAEQLSDMDGARLAAQYGALSADHLEYLSEAGVRAMSESGTVAVLLPGAFYYLRETRQPPIDLLRRYKVPMAIASDCNPGSSPVGSLLAMINMACVLFQLTPEEALAGVTCHGARALGIHDKAGTLTPGKEADFVVWDIDDPAELAYGLGFNPCRQIIRSGEVVEPIVD